MKTLIIGAGAVGVAIGASLQSRGFDVTFLAKGNTGNYIRENGVKRTGIFGDIEVLPSQISVVSDYDGIKDFDYIIVSAKTMANAEIAKNLASHREILGQNGKIVIFQNGWGNDVPYLEYFDKNQVYNARIITGFERITPGVSKVTVHTAPILLGSLYGMDAKCMEPLAKAICESGIPSEVTNEVAKALWAKMLFNTTLNPLGAILNLSYGKMSELENARIIMNKLIDETYEVMTAEGYTTFWASPDEYREAFYGKLVPDTYLHRSSTLQDIEKKQKTEIDTLNGCIVKLASARGIKVPTHEMIVNLIKAIENK